MPAQLKFDQILEINGNKLTKKYIESLSVEDRLKLIDPIFDLLRNNGFIYMDDSNQIKRSWIKLIEYEPDINSLEVFNNSSLATDICKYFCHSFYFATEKHSKTILNIFNDDKMLKKIVRNRLGLDWLDGTNESFNLSFKMVAIQAQRSMRLVNMTSMFKPSIAKYICLKYSQPGDVVGDYSCGFGGRLLGALSCNRKYIGTDPLTIPELEQMCSFFNLQDCKLIQQGSEDYIGDENSIDLYWSSPPYFDKEYYSSDATQAYNQGKDYFYNTYWKKTLKNVKYMLKPGKWFGLNVKDDYMLESAKQEFGEILEIVKDDADKISS